MKGSPNRLLVLGLLFGAGLILLIPGTQGRSLPGQGDEAMHIETVRGSLENKSYLYPELLGQINAYKPPLMFWLSMPFEAAMTGLTGTSTFGLLGVRLVSVFAAILSAFVIYHMLLFMKKNEKSALLFSFLYLTSFAVFKFGRLLMFEQLMALNLLLVVYSFLLYDKYKLIRYLLISAVLTGIGYLHKGPLFLIYSAVFYTAWAVSHLYRPDSRQARAGFLSVNGLRRVIYAAVIITVVSLVPVALYYLYVLNHPQGDALIGYFYWFENAAKFTDKNQSEASVLFGWILYTFPWMFLLLPVFFSAFRRKPLITYNRYVQQWMILTLAGITLFHFIPNRKADYYVVPMIGLLVFAAGLGSIRFSLLKTTALVLVLAAAAVGTVLFFHESYAASVFYLLLPFLLTAAYLLTSDAEKRFRTTIAAGFLFMASLPFLVSPVFYRPVLPQSRAEAIDGRSVCIVTEEPWEAMSASSVIRNSEVSQGHPAAEVPCAGMPDYILSVRKADMNQNGYEPVAGWNIYKIQNIQQYLNRLSSGESVYDPVTLYARKNQTAGGSP